MAVIQTPFNNQIIKARLESGESLIVEFQPDGANAAPLSKTISFIVGSLFLPNGRIGLSVRFEPGTLYQSGNTFVLLDDPNGADKLDINGMVLERIRAMSQKEKPKSSLFID